MDSPKKPEERVKDFLEQYNNPDKIIKIITSDEFNEKLDDANDETLY